MHTTVLVDPAGERRKERRARRKASQRLSCCHSSRRHRIRPRRDRKLSARIDVRRPTCPPPGSRGPPRSVHPAASGLPRHQDTSATLAGAYPFLAEGGLGSQGVFVGQDLYSGARSSTTRGCSTRAGMITAPNIVLAGIVGSGKSSLVKSLYTRSIPFGRRVYVPGDPKGEHTAVAEAVGGQAIVLGHGMANRLNPLDEGHRPSGSRRREWAGQVASRRRDLIGALTETVLERRTQPAGAHRDRPRSRRHRPLVRDPDPADGRRPTSSPRTHLGEPTAASSRTAGSSGTHSVGWSPATSPDCSTVPAPSPSTRRLPMISLDLSRVAENATLISVLMTCSSAWMESALLDPHGGQRWVIYDEAWRLMSHPALLRRMDAQWRLARHYGIANMLDLPQALRPRQRRRPGLRDARARVIAARQRRDPDHLPAGSGPARSDRDRARASPAPSRACCPARQRVKGSGGSRTASFVVQHQLHPAELAAFDTTSRMTEGVK